MEDIVRASVANIAKENARYQKPSAHQALNGGDEVTQKKRAILDSERKPSPKNLQSRAISATCPDDSRQMNEIVLTLLPSGKVETRLQVKS